METDDDNKMSYVEILNAAMELNEQFVDENIVRAFRALELGNTGCVSCGEIIEVMGDPEAVLRFCDDGDLNTEGQIGFQEFKVAVHRLDQNSEGFRRIMSLGREEEEDQSASLTSQNVSSKSMEGKKSGAASTTIEVSSAVSTSPKGAAHNVAPPPPPTADSTEVEGDESGDGPKKMKFHRPSLIKALFPKDKDKAK